MIPTFALVADDVLLERQFANGAFVQIFERNCELVDNVLTFALLSLATEAFEEHVEDVHGRGEVAAHATFLQSLLATFVVDALFLRIGKDFVRLRDLFELWI